MEIEQGRADGRERDARSRPERPAGCRAPRDPRVSGSSARPGASAKARSPAPISTSPVRPSSARAKTVTTSPAVAAAASPSRRAEHRHQGRVQPALADDPAHEVGQPERRQKRIRHGPRAERLREQHVADESEDPRRARAEADQKGGADDRHAASRLAGCGVLSKGKVRSALWVVLAQPAVPRRFRSPAVMPGLDPAPATFDPPPRERRGWPDQVRP